MRQLLWLSCWLLSGAAAPVEQAAQAGFKLRILHTNDMHSRFDEVSRESGPCSERESNAGRCYGGFARLASLLREARASAEGSDEPLLFLNAGDTYQGTKLYSHYKSAIVVKFLNMLRPDAVSLGNHEFDDQVSGLLPYLEQANFPVLAANLDLSEEPTLRNSSTRLAASSVLQLPGGRQVCVVGYLTPETAQLSQPGRVRFLDEVDSLRTEVARLRNLGCSVIVALGHSGYEVDKRIAREVPHLDLVIGGHTNTFLYNGAQPDREVPEGPYPTEVLQPDGRRVYVVQAYAYTKYLGDLHLEFDAAGEVLRATGAPLLVDASVPQAEDVQSELRRWQKPLHESTARLLGLTRVLLDGDEKHCRLVECNLGNLLADAMVHYATASSQDDGWSDSPAAVAQAGGIRSSISSANDGKVTMNDVLTSLPFGSKMYRVELDGRTLRSVLEWSVHDRIDHNTTQHGGAFLQLSGLQVDYDLSKPVGSRVVALKLRCGDCAVPVFRELQPEARYPLLINDFLHNGGDGYAMLRDLPYKDFNVTLADVLAQYINQTSPLHPGIEGRINFVEVTSDSSPSSATKQLSTPISLGLLLLLQFKSLMAFARFF